MGLALDTIGLTATQAASASNPLDLAAVSGDSLTVRNFATTDKAYLEAIGLQFATHASGDNIQITSPQLADDVTGLNFQPLDNPAGFLMPRQVPQRVYPGDTLAAQVTDGTNSDVSTATLHMYYPNLPGAGARITRFAQISGAVINEKPVEVSITTVAGSWVDTLLGTNGAVLKSERDYAVLGYMSDVAVTAIGVKGAFTSNYRACGPGVTAVYDTAEYFLQMDAESGQPHISVFNGKDVGAVYVSVLAPAVVTPVVTLLLAELPNNVVPQAS